MAKIVGPVPPFIGTRDNVTIYLMNGEYIARTKSSLTGKRVKKDPAFARTMEWAGRLKQGARIASIIYKQMPVDERIYKQYRELTGKAMSLLKEGFSIEDVIIMLEAVYLPQGLEDSENVVVSVEAAFELKNESTESKSVKGKLFDRSIYNPQGAAKHPNKCNSASVSEYSSNEICIGVHMQSSKRRSKWCQASE
jgi:hypothetical protein